MHRHNNLQFKPNDMSQFTDEDLLSNLTRNKDDEINHDYSDDDDDLDQ